MFLLLIVGYCEKQSGDIECRDSLEFKLSIKAVSVTKLRTDGSEYNSAEDKYTAK